MSIMAKEIYNTNLLSSLSVWINENSWYNKANDITLTKVNKQSLSSVNFKELKLKNTFLYLNSLKNEFCLYLFLNQYMNCKKYTLQTNICIFTN